MHFPSSTLKLLDAVYHSALRFTTGDGFRTHRCILYEKVGWQSLAVRREQHCMLFIYEALLGKLPGYLSCLFNYRSLSYCTRSQDYSVLKNHHVSTEIGKMALKYYAPHKWNNLQRVVKLDKLIPFNQFKSLLTDRTV